MYNRKMSSFTFDATIIIIIFIQNNKWISTKINIDDQDTPIKKCLKKFYRIVVRVWYFLDKKNISFKKQAHDENHLVFPFRPLLF